MLQSKLKWNFAELQEGKIIENHELDNLSPVIRELLLQRGIATKEEMYNFLHPNLDKLYSTSEIDMIDKAVTRIHIERAEGEKILVNEEEDEDEDESNK